MDKNRIPQAEKLQTKLDKLLQIKEKRQKAFEKSKRELNAVSKEIDSVKLKLFEILQSGSDDVKFSDWAKKRISENGNIVKNENTDSENPVNHEKPIMQNHQTRTEQNQNQRHTPQ